MNRHNCTRTGLGKLKMISLCQNRQFAISNVKNSWNKCYWQFNAGISFIQNHPPSGTRVEGSKNRPPGQSLCAKTLPLGQSRESKAPPPGHKVRKFHKCIYKLWHYLKWKALWSQQIKRFLNEETDYWSISYLVVTRVKLLNMICIKLYMICIIVY